MKKKMMIIFIIAILSFLFFYHHKEQYYDTNIVILDAGHGGNDSGAIYNNIKEKDINLKAAKYIGQALEKENITVIYTRESDIELSINKKEDLKKRAQLSKQYHAECFISIHVNDYKKEVSGFEIYTNQNSHASSIASTVEKKMKHLNYSESRGIKDGTHLRVLRLNEVPSLLIELGFINSQDRDYLNNDKKLEKLCQSISEGIIERIK